jgi:hypothetical protein
VGRSFLLLAVAATLAVTTAADPFRSVYEQRRSGGGRLVYDAYQLDVPYDGRLTFVRLAWRGGNRNGCGWNSAWNHDYPRAEQHLSQILRELTYTDIRLDGSRIMTLDDPELFRYPIAFMWEPGFWALTDVEAAAFGAYLRKGGFAVFEDFDGQAQWRNFEAQMRRVLPGSQFVELDGGLPIFNAFFQIKDIEAIVHPMAGLRPRYLGIFEDNNPAKRLMVVANFDNDIPEYWEWSGRGLFPFDSSNEAYKLGVNYMVYGLTH